MKDERNLDVRIQELQHQVLELVELIKVLSGRLAKLEKGESVDKRITKLEREIILLQNSIKVLSPTMSEEGKIEAQNEINKMVQEEQPIQEESNNIYK